MTIAKKPTIAICYDFDGTLAPGNMQENSFLPDIGLTPSEFWSKVKEIAKKHDMDEILAYMHLMLKEANTKEQQIFKKSFKEHGEQIGFFPGVQDWFDRITTFGKDNNAIVQHYIISSGLREMIEGCTIAKKFNYIFASGFLYDHHDMAIWPALTVNYTSKTQYLFRINKGIGNSWDNTKINQYTPNEMRPVPFTNIIYLGDGDTDIPAMKMVKYQGGTAIAVYPEKKGKRVTKTETQKKENAKKLLKDLRADYIAPANYCVDSEIDRIVKNHIQIVAKRHESIRIGVCS
jgi:phosphoserine phosphatase